MTRSRDLEHLVRARVFVAIDFETGDELRDSACAVGLARVEDGAIVAHETRLVRPPRPIKHDFTAIHGITNDHVAGAPSWAEVWGRVSPLTTGVDLFVAHNAEFDWSVLEACNRAAGLPVPTTPWACTCKAARAAFAPKLENNKLSTVAAALGIALKHHDPHSDVRACALIACALKRTAGEKDGGGATLQERCRAYIRGRAERARKGSSPADAALLLLGPGEGPDPLWAARSWGWLDQNHEAVLDTVRDAVRETEAA